MSRQPQLFPTFKKGFKTLSHLFTITPVPIRVALFPMFIMLGSLPLALIALFTETASVPRAYETQPPPAITTPVNPHS
jgi:hypothetical protein